jgi:hypothetical protein
MTDSRSPTFYAPSRSGRTPAAGPPHKDAKGVKHARVIVALTHHPTWRVVVTPDPLPAVGAQQPEVGALYLNPKHSTRMDNVTSPITEMVDNPPVMRLRAFFGWCDRVDRERHGGEPFMKARPKAAVDF